MSKIVLADLLAEESTVETRVGMASANNIDKSGVVYIATAIDCKNRIYPIL